MNTDIPAHEQAITHRYSIRFPEHSARASDPHYRLFEEVRRHWQKTDRWHCAVGVRLGSFDECDTTHPLELHHAHLEFALANEVDLALVTRDFPDIANEDELQAWIESEANLIVLCAFHHRGHGGVHVVSASDWEAEKYIRGLIT